MEQLSVDPADPDGCSPLRMLADEENLPGSLTSCLRAFITEEILRAANAYECEKCCLPQNKEVIFYDLLLLSS